MKRLLVIGHTYPEPSTTAAGKRMMQLLEHFQVMNFEILFTTTASRTAYNEDLGSLQIESQQILLNDDSFDQLLKEFSPDIALFDRFMTEEQFSWRVAEQCPDALRILDTEDLHFLRKAREQAVQNQTELNLDSDLTKRELASILRSDLSLIISEAEIELLTERFQIHRDLLEYLPITYGKNDSILPYEERTGYVTIGNLQHPPNKDGVLFLVNSVWPMIRKLDPSAELKIYGSYATEEISHSHDPANGINIQGWAEDLSEVLSKARVLLAPLRFGAGLKGKVLDAFYYGTPVITTPIGAEGIAAIQQFGGVVAEGAEDMAKAAVELNGNPEMWQESSERAIDILEQSFATQDFVYQFAERIQSLLESISEHRNKHYLSKVIWHQSLKASYFMGKWITEKNKNRN